MSNEIKAYYQRNPGIQGVYVCFTLGFGSRDERSDEQGYAHFLEHLIMSNQKLSEVVEARGGQLDAGTGHEEMTFQFVVPKQFLSQSLDSLKKEVFDLSIDSDMVSREKEIVLCEIDESDEMIDEYYELFFRNHDLGRSILGTKASIQKIGVDKMSAFYSRIFSTSRAVISIISDLPDAEVEAMFNDAFGTVSLEANHRVRKAFYYCDSFEIWDKTNLPEDPDHVILGFPIPKYDHEDDLYIQLAICMFEDRVYQRLRVENQLIYDIDLNAPRFSDCGLLYLEFDVEKSKTKRAIALIKSEMNRLTKGISKNDFEKLKNRFAGRVLLRQDDYWALSEKLAKNLLFNGNCVSPENEIENIRNLELSHFNSVCLWFFQIHFLRTLVHTSNSLL
ncbi:Predicted Zn-dependent peptidase [Reichenbachiella faecimaris]|uniref:Predicted Zn-dependent peptidase n=1 Tax=Reichenbachiella faecimaris TaxID=692418 RepID=A0A1W2G7B4_REIFA|nr:pitrilysin family protein [Reichenbachiella faecimaris]SMD32557.1 Predicted Zn-dependent peptidase [Reichenbachiella faecimaris]